jgi:ABC-2 type transport system ATP-binding protein
MKDIIRKMNAIEIKGLKKYFGKTKAVDGVTFEVKKGEVFGFLGPNGAGKTTTIRCLMDFLRPTEGEITILGKDSKKDSVELKSKIGYLSGNVKLNNNWTGREHVKFVESIRGKSGNVTELCGKFDLDLSKKFKQLSSGNKQKLGLVLALMSDPEILIMDEPTVGLDPLLQNTIYEILLDMKDRGKTIFVSSHNLAEVERLCDRVGIIKNGKMVEVETLKGLEGKKLHKVEVRFNEKVKKSDFNFDGVEKIEEIADGLILTVGGDMNRIVKKLSSYKIADLTISHATLEEVFLKFYERK